MPKENRKFYSLVVNEKTADLAIYGDICSWPWLESDVSAYNLSKQLDELTDVDTINVNINSYGGEVAEGLAIYNSLRRHSAKVVTRCDGFACSIASVIFMAGDERIMHDASLLMIHNAWTRAVGNAAELRKAAEDIEAITQASKNAYTSHVSITEEKLTELMDAESWIAPQDALDWGFATAIESFEESENPSQNARLRVFEKFMQTEDPKDPEDPEDDDPETDPETDPDDGGEDPEPEEDPDEGESGNANKAAQLMAAFFMSMKN